MLRRWSAGLILLLWGIGIYLGEQPSAASAAARNATTSSPALPSQASETKPKHSIVYVNDRYSFRFYLPRTWKGYSLISGRWQGGNPNQQDSD